VLVGEVLWDRFPDSARLGGALLNVAVHLKRRRHHPVLVSAVGTDALGEQAKEAIRRSVSIRDCCNRPNRQRHCSVRRRGRHLVRDRGPAAYDAVALSDATLGGIGSWNPA
jgi:fructokinase